MSKTRFSPHLANRLLNTPLAISASYYMTMLGALQSRGVPVTSLQDGDTNFDSESLAQIAADYTSDNEERSGRPYYIVDGIAYVSVTGALVHKYGHLNPYSGMTGYDGIRANIDLALVDPEVRAIALDMDSPGGEVSGCFALGDYIFSQVRGKKPIWALIDELSCSASYAISAACDKVIVTETGIAGSIGVICGHTDMTKAYEDAGYKVTLFYSGSHKADMHPLKPLDDALSAEMQATMIELHELFASKVSAWRNASFDAIKGTESQVYRGQKAVDANLADAVMNTDQFHYEIINTLTAAKGGNNLGAQAMPPLATAPKSTATTILETNNAEVSATTEPEETGVVDKKETMSTIGAATVTDNAAATERDRVFAIMGCEAAATRPNLAKQLAKTPGMSLEQASVILNAAGVETALAASTGKLDALMASHSENPLDDDSAGTDAKDERATMNAVMNQAYGQVKRK